jgi:hypothetical protein
MGKFLIAQFTVGGGELPDACLLGGVRHSLPDGLALAGSRLEVAKLLDFLDQFGDPVEEGSG